MLKEQRREGWKTMSKGQTEERNNRRVERESEGGREGK